MSCATFAAHVAISTDDPLLRTTIKAFRHRHEGHDIEVVFGDIPTPRAWP